MIIKAPVSTTCILRIHYDFGVERGPAHSRVVDTGKAYASQDALQQGRVATQTKFGRQTLTKVVARDEADHEVESQVLDE